MLHGLKYTAICFLVGNLSFAQIVSNSPFSEYEKYKKMADIAYFKGDYNRAISLYRACLAVPQFDKDVYSIQQIANCNLCQSFSTTASFLLKQENQEEAAILIFEKLLNVNPDDSVTKAQIGFYWLKKANKYFQKEQFQLAIGGYEKAQKYANTKPEISLLVDSCNYYIDRNTNGYFSYEVQIPPTFAGGNEQLSKFFTKNAKYPPKAQENNIKGKVTVSFIVDEKGKIKSPKVLKGIGYGCDEEALRMFEIMPNWLPGKRYGKTVPTRLTFSVPFLFE
jgi:TonB family protein